MKRVLRFNTALLSIVLALGSIVVSAQQTAKMSPSGRGYLEYLPPGYSTTTELYPCIIFLHGAGERGDGSPAQLTKVTAQGTPKFIKNGAQMCFTVNGKNECFIVLSPQQTTDRWGWLGYEVMPFITWALTQYRIDPDRVYVTGLSMGGGGAWNVSYAAENDPNYLAAIAPVSAGGDYNGGKITAQRKIPVWAFHGSADTSVPVSENQRPINGMLSVGANPVPILTIYQGTGHNGATWDRAYSPTHTYHNPNMYEWFLTYKKPTLGPKPPTANAGSDKIITLPTSSVSITGTATDPDGSISSVLWTQTSGPSSATISAPSNLTTTVSSLVEGTYVFNLRATDNSGMTSNDQVTVQVKPQPLPVPPVANAGSDKTITAPASTLVLTGSGSDSDGTITSYAWSQSGGPNTATLGGQSTNTLNLSGLIPGAYTFTLTVTDNQGLSASDQVVVTVLAAPPNVPPVANAGADKTITLPINTSTINGSATDSDGTIASYAWSQTSGPSSATIVSPGQAITNLSNLSEGVYVFTLLVTDNLGATDVDQVIVTVLPVPPNALPTANAGTDITITLPTNSTNLNGSGTDTDGTIASYAWAQTSGPSASTITSPSQATTSVTGLSEGNYVFTLTVTDNNGAAGSDQVLVKVLPEPPNQPPTANAGSDKNITLPTSTVQLVGSGVDSDGTISSYQWTQQSGPTSSTIVSPSQGTTNVSGLAAGVYTFILKVTDNKGATGSDQVRVNVFPPANVSPVAEAGTNQTITLPTNSVTLSGSGTDSDGTIASYLWEKISGPSSSNFSSTASATTTVSALTEGIYVFSITVTDDDGATSSDQVTITVQPEPPNQLPTANAGADKNLTLPDNSVTLTGSGSDPDGTVASYLWTFISGPATGTSGAVDGPTLALSDLVEGIYVFSLTVTDNAGATAEDEVKVFVNTINQPPVANAGSNKTITLPTSTVTLAGSGSDPDGTVTSYSWQQTSGPSSAVIDDPVAATINVSGLVNGTYVFTLRVTDNEGITDADAVTVTVNPEPANIPPVANPGSNLEITLPVAQVTINGTGTDADGTVTGYAWSQVSGPSTATTTPTTQANITFSNLIAGTYVFRLTVTDNKGAKGQKDVNVKVNPQPGNNPPVANAGADKQITLPANSVSLVGSGSDVDGTITAYEWTQVSGPSTANLTAPGSATTDATNLVEGIYVLRLSVTDDKGVSIFDEVLVTVNPVPYNLPPIANAGSNIVITLPATFTSLTGAGTDADGTVVGYSWAQISGPNTATTSPLAAEDLDLSDLVEGIYLFRLTVTDDDGSTGFDEVNVRVQPPPSNQPPTANGGQNKVITLPDNSASFTGSGQDPDGTIASVLWVQDSGPTSATLSSTSVATLNVSDLIEGTYVFKITVKDNNGAEGFDQVNVRVNPALPNAPPVANAGNDLTVTLPTNAITISATATDSDGTIASQSWSQLSGPASTMTGTSSLNLDLADLIEGVYLFRLTVTDDGGATAFDEVAVTVNRPSPNEPPIVDAGIDLDVVAPPNTLHLSGTASDSDGTVALIAWSQVSGPNASSIATPNALSTDVNNIQLGTYVFRLTVTDDQGTTTSDEVLMNVVDNLPPVAFAGDPVELNFPENAADLTGGGSDPDGTIVSFLWEAVSGPPNTVIATPDAATTTVSGLVVGSYTFRLTVSDNSGASASSIVTVTVNPSDGNQPPTALAGEDVTAFLPDPVVELAGQGEDSDGTIVSYHWAQLEGPSDALVSTPDEAVCSLSGLVQGTYRFELTVTDDGGLTATDDVLVIVQAFDIENLTLHKVFSPNGDGNNDTWTWPNPEIFEGCVLRIYNQSGKLVYEKESYDNSWDGKHNGVDLAEDVYFYIITCQDDEITGGVRIIR